MAQPADRAALAAHNNAAWCSAVCGAHGDAGTWTRSAWVHRGPTPPYYPNAVTLRAAADAAALLDGLPPLPRTSCAVKDSFSRLDLSGQGFRCLFDATWLWREAAAAPNLRLAPWPAWRRVRSAGELAAWEAAWWRDAEPDPPGPRPRLYLETLLEHPDLVFLAGHDGARLVAGGALSRTQAAGASPVVGLACCFGAGIDAAGGRGALVAQAVQHFPGLPLVGYESGTAESAMRACGFEAVGPLRVWLQEAAGGSSLIDPSSTRGA
jgi:hypothetical protein